MERLLSGDPVGAHWRFINRQGHRVKFGADQTQTLQQFPTAATNGRLRKLMAREPMFPFRIYQLPGQYRDTLDPSSDWLKICVRAGRVLWFDATGTDGQNDDPDSETFPVSSGVGVGEITCTSNVPKFWIWLEIDFGAPSAVVKSGSDPTTNGWTAFPMIDANHLPIGFIDTQTNLASKILVIRQLLRADVIQIGSICY